MPYTCTVYLQYTVRYIAVDVITMPVLESFPDQRSSHGSHVICSIQALYHDEDQ